MNSSILPIAFTHRIVDNTLPQSAVHFLATRNSGGALDPAARFETFVDSFINAPIRCATLPGQEVGVCDEFVQLWQMSADETGHSVGATNIKVDEKRLLHSYAAALAASSVGWSGWLCLQLTARIAEQYKSRVVDWRSRIEYSLSFTRWAISPLNPTRNHRMAQFRDEALVPALAALRANRARIRLMRSIELILPASV